MRLWEAENARNERNEALFRAMIQMAYPDVDLVVAGHHIFYRKAGATSPEEIPSADWLIFDHTIAKAVWGDNWQCVIGLFAAHPADTRDNEVRLMFNQVHGTTF